MRRRALLRVALAAVVVLDLVLGCWWMLKSDAPDVGRPRSRTWQQAEFGRSAMPALPPRHPPPREETAGAEEDDAPSVPAPTRPRPSGPSHLVLQVADASKAPLAGVTVVATESNGSVRSTVTAADGAARFESVTHDAVEIVLSRNDLATQRIRPAALDSGVRTIRLMMTPGRAIDGVVLETDGTPVGGAVVTVGDTVAWPATATTSYDGRFRIAGVPAFAVTLYASAPLHTTGNADVVPGRDSVELRLAPACRLYGTVCDPSGAPVADALVTAIPEGDRDRSRAQRGWTDADGRYAMDGIPLGVAWVVEATKPGFAAGVSSSPVLLDADHRSAWCNLALRPAARVSVHVVDEESQPMSGVVVEIRLPATGWYTRHDTDADGVEQFNVPGSGACRVTAHANGGAEWFADVDVAEGDERTVELRRPPSGDVEGIVEDDLGRPVADAEVRVGAETARSGRDGRFRVERVMPGRCRADASADGFVAGTSGEITVPAADVRIGLVRMGSVSFRVRAPTGTPSACEVEFLGVGSRPHLPEGACQGKEVRVPAPPGDGRVVVRVHGFLPVERETTVRPGEDTSLGEIVLDEGVTLEVRVTDDAGKPVRRANVGSSLAPSGLRLRTDADGVARAEHVDPATRGSELTVEADGFETVTVACESVASPVVVTLRRLGRLSVTVKGVGGGATDGTSTQFEPLDRPTAANRTTTRVQTESDRRGATQAWLPVGRWRVRVLRGATILGEREVDVNSGDNPPVEILLER